MEQTPEYTLPEQTEKLIDSGRYKDAFTLLRRRLTETPLPRALSELSQAESTYRYLLQYYAQGATDPGREGVLADIRSRLLDIADGIDRENSVTDSPQLYYSTLRMCRMHPSDIDTLLKTLVEKNSMMQLSLSAGEYPDTIAPQLEDEEGKLFDTLWTADSIPTESYRRLSEAINGGTLAFTTSALAIAATGLGLMRFFNRDAILLLCDAASSPDERISARATAVLLIVLSRHAERVAGDQRLIQRLQSLMETENMTKKFRSAVVAAIRTRDTDRVSRKMQRDVIPGLMQMGPDILKRLKEKSEDSSFADLEANPEWEELLHNSGLEEKLRELTEMQTDGADVMMVAFSNLKGFPFFRQIRNWLLPFSSSHSQLKSFRTEGGGSLDTMMTVNGLMCDSDRYSFALSLAGMPESQRKMVQQQMNAQMEQFQEQMKEIEALKSGKGFEEELTRFFRDLYRFHKLFPKRAEFTDPFAAPLDYISIPVIGGLLDTPDLTQPVAEFYFKRGYHAEALPMLKRLADTASDTPHIWEKIGYCHEKQPEGWKDAIEAYMKAQLFNPDSRWISRRLGMCYRRSGDYRNAADYIRMAMPTDNAYDRALTLLLADTLADGGKWDEALNELYRVDYETPGDGETLRRMAKCAMHTRQFDKAESWISSIPTIDLSEEDHRMAGHIAMLKGDIPSAIANYRLTVRRNDDKREWKKQILADMPMLESLGASRREMQLLLESIAYTLE